MPSGHLVIATFILPVIEVMFSLSPTRTRSDKPNTTLVSFIWTRTRAGEHRAQFTWKQPQSLYFSSHQRTSGETLAKLRSANWKWAARGGWGEKWRALSNTDRPIEIMAGSSRWHCQDWHLDTMKLHQNILVFSLIVCFMDPNQFLPAKMSLFCSPRQNLFRK